jgi:hypothetical protein
MAKLVPFPITRVKKSAAALLKLRESCARPVLWQNRPVPPELLGNMLQHLARKEPATVCVLENVVAEILEQVDPAWVAEQFAARDRVLREAAILSPAPVPPSVSESHS